MRPRRVALSATAVVAGVVLAGCTSAGGPVANSTSPTSISKASTTTSPTGPARSSALSWSSCDGQFQCARLSVPLSYSGAAPGTIQLEVVRLAATGPHPVGDLVLNPGGPGVSGVDFLEQGYTEFPSSLRASFNLVSFDPRGIGRSTSVNCVTPAQTRALLALPPAPTTPAQVTQLVSATKAFVAGCLRSAPLTLLQNVSTADTARDLDRLRAALGDAKLTYLGYSYGTYLGTIYAELFPQHVRALVLDGTIDPALSVTQIESVQSRGFEQELHDFLSWCTRSGQCGAISQSSDPYAAYEHLISQFKDGLTLPATLTPAFGGNQQVDYGVALTGVLQLLYAPSLWRDLGTALTQAESGNGNYLAAYANLYAGAQQDGTYQNIISANPAISCLDRPSVTGLAAIEQLAARLAQESPDLGASEAWGNLTCAYWPVPAQSKPAPANAPGAPPILVVGSTRDPATPYAWAKALAAQLPGAVLLTRTGDGHTGYAFSSCIRSWVDRYLVTLALPPAGTVCASDGPGLP